MAVCILSSNKGMENVAIKSWASHQEGAAIGFDYITGSKLHPQESLTQNFLKRLAPSCYYHSGKHFTLAFLGVF